MSKKVNPRRIPASKADVNKAKKVAENSTMDMCVAIILMGLLDKGYLDKDDVPGAWDAINAKSEAVKKKYCSVHDLKKALRDEYEIYLD